MKIDRSVFGFESRSDANKNEIADLKKLSYEDKSKVITFLRENYYGSKATTGRIQRVFGFSKQK